MDLLQGLIEGIHKQGESAEKRAEKDKDMKLTKLTERDDIEAYMKTFERMMVSYEIKPDRWVFKLAPQLTGKAQQAYAALHSEKAADYETVKKAILARYDINQESYRQRFRSIVRLEGETNRELTARLHDLTSKWLQDCKTVAEDLVVMEQLINMLPVDVRIFVKERKPSTSEEAAKLADDYWQARKSSFGEKKQSYGKPGGKYCHKCSRTGHLAKDCKRNGNKQPEGSEEKTTVIKQDRVKKDLKDIECFNCHLMGHYSSNCPQRALYCMERRMNHQGGSIISKRRVLDNPGVTKPGIVEGKPVRDILLDTGCSRTLVRKDLVPKHKLLHGEVVAIRCAHGDTVLYPLVEVELEVQSYPLKIEAAVSDTLPVPVLLGVDIPELTAILSGDWKPRRGPAQELEDALVVTTRGMARRQEVESATQVLKEQESGAEPKELLETGNEETPEADTILSSQLDTEETRDVHNTESTDAKETTEDHCTEDNLLQALEEDIIVPGNDRPYLTRKKKRDNKSEFQRIQKQSLQQLHPLDISMSQFKTLQEEDPTLESIRRAAENCPSLAGIGFFKRDGLLYRRWVPPRQGLEAVEVEQLVLPKKCREDVLKIAHDIPLAGHMGKEKTARRILQRFYWPTLYVDVAKFCKACMVCQKFSRHKARRAPLIPLPVIEEPFKRIAMDIVGPLPRSSSGQRYILVVCDYATRYPEAIPLKSIDASHIAEQLVTLFSRYGVPEEILTDQGSNFTSQLLTEIYRMLHVYPIRTTPYHPQTDGLVERFNQTLKAMLKKAATDEGKDWDRVIPYLLFAYREVPQSSTGFSPFELLYGRSVRGPLDVLREGWETDKCDNESVISHLLTMRERFKKMSCMVQENLEAAQKVQKRWYDQNARQRQFEAGDQVLVLLPTSKNKLVAQWQGPYEVGDAVPVQLPPYRIAHAYRSAVKEEIEQMLAEGIIEPSSSAYSSPIVLVPKKDQALRLCVDYRKLNKCTQADAYPMPRIDDLIDRLGNSRYISTLDLTKGYWQVPVAVEDRPKTAFSSPFGLYQFRVMPFGLQGAPATFQRLVDGVIAGLEDFTSTYLDDVVIFSNTWEDHLKHIRSTLDRIRKAGLTVKAKKSQFGADHCVYLGHLVGGGMVQPEAAKVEAVRNFPVPTTKKQVRTFLGLSGYYRRFIPQYASIALPLTDLTRKSSPNEVIWTDVCDQAFLKLKSLLCSSPILASPNFQRPFVLQTDASDRGIGAVLSQEDEDSVERPIAYYSRKLAPREERYSVIEKECLAIKDGITAFQVYLLGRPFTIQTDHRALVWLNQLKDKNSRLTRWSLLLQPYQFKVHHRIGSANGNADALSRLPSNPYLTLEKEGGV